MSTVEFPQAECPSSENYLVLQTSSSRESAQEMIETTRSGIRQDAEGIFRIEGTGERVYTKDGAAACLKVTTKTIERLQDAGLLKGEYVTFPNNRMQWAFLESAIAKYRNEHPNRARLGARFRRLTEKERDGIIEAARQLAQNGEATTPTAAARQLTEQQTGRYCMETARKVLSENDRKHPNEAIFPNRTGPPNEKLRKEMRARKILELPLDYMYNENFDKPNASKEILGPMPPGEDSRKRKSRAPSGLPPYLASLYETPLLTPEQERYLFCKFNYLKHKASRLCEGLDPERPNKKIMDKIEQLHEEAVGTKNAIVQANLRLVVSMVKRHCNPRNPDEFFGLVSDGNISLMRAVEKFDYARGNKFSTYAGWAIRKNFARTIPGEFKHQDRFRTSLEEMFVSKVDDRADQFEQENAQRLREEQVGRILSRLDEREQKVIISRFGLDHAQEPQTLKEVGADLGVTKERIRQIEARALEKLRLAAREERLELPD